MQVTSEQVDPCTLTLKIVVDEEQVARTFDKTYREFSRVVNVPGFVPVKPPAPFWSDTSTKPACRNAPAKS